MQHLTLEALARLVDEPAEPHEGAHLRGCLVCRRELDEMRAEIGALAELDDPEPPAHGWAALEAALRSEGLVRDVPARLAASPSVVRDISTAPGARPRYARPALKAAAAAAVFFLGGGAMGWFLWGRAPAEDGGMAGNQPTQGQPVYVRGPGDEASGGGARLPLAGPLPGEDPLIYVEEAPVPAASPDVRLASEGAARPAPRVRRYERPAAVAPEERSVVLDAAGAELLQAELAYRSALQRYAQAAEATRSADPQVRLAALERLVTATSTALERSPDDPVVNGYHLAAVRERDEVRRRIASDAQKNWF
jgi:hypothetical protein